jgi:hypothetical protein
MDNSTRPRQRNFVVGLIVIGLMIVVVFGLRTVRAFRQFQEHRPPPPFATQPSETDVNRIRDWMTIPFISKMYHVRQHILFEGVGIPEQGNRDKSLRQLNEEYFPEAPGIVETKIKATLLENMPPGMPITPPALP